MKDLQIQVNREVSEKIRDHLTAQHAQATDEVGKCMYRGKLGSMCAVGCLIPDDEYAPWMEGTGIAAKTAAGGEIWAVMRELYGDYLLLELLREWQFYHDRGMYAAWCAADVDPSPDLYHEELMRRMEEWIA